METRCSCHHRQTRTRIGTKQPKVVLEDLKEKQGDLSMSNAIYRYSEQFRKDVVEYAEFKSVADASRVFGIHEKTVRLFLAEAKKQLENEASKHAQSNLRPFRPSPIKSPPQDQSPRKLCPKLSVELYHKVMEFLKDHKDIEASQHFKIPINVVKQWENISKKMKVLTLTKSSSASSSQENAKKRVAKKRRMKEKRQYSVDIKLAVAKFAKTYSLDAAVVEYNIPRSTIADWLSFVHESDSENEESQEVSGKNDLRNQSSKRAKTPSRVSRPIRRKSYPSSRMAAVIKFAKENGISKAHLKYNIPMGTIHNWVHNPSKGLRRKISSFINAGSNVATKPSSMSRINSYQWRWKEHHRRLTKEVNRELAKSQKLNRNKIEKMARKLAKDLKISRFNGSNGWYHRFLQRSGLKKRIHLSMLSMECSQAETLQEESTESNASKSLRGRRSYDSAPHSGEVVIDLQLLSNKTNDTPALTYEISDSAMEKLSSLLPPSEIPRDGQSCDLDVTAPPNGEVVIDLQLLSSKTNDTLAMTYKIDDLVPLPMVKPSSLQPISGIIVECGKKVVDTNIQPLAPSCVNNPDGVLPLPNTKLDSLLLPSGNSINSLPQSSHSPDSVPPPGCADIDCKTMIIESLVPSSDQPIVIDTTTELLTSEDHVPLTHSHEKPDRNDQERTVLDSSLHCSLSSAVVPYLGNVARGMSSFLPAVKMECNENSISNQTVTTVSIEEIDSKKTNLNGTRFNFLLPLSGDIIDLESSHSSDSLPPPGCSDTSCQTPNIESPAPPSGQVLITDTEIDLHTSDNQVPPTNSHEERNSNNEEGIVPEPDTSNVLQPVDVEDKTLEYAGHQGFSERTYSHDSGENKKHIDQVSNDADVMPAKSAFQKPVQTTLSSTEHNSLLPQRGDMVDSLPEACHSADPLSPPGSSDTNCRTLNIESLALPSGQVLLTDTKMDLLTSDNQVSSTNPHEERKNNDERIAPEPDRSNVLQPVDIEDKTLEYAGRQGLSEKAYSTGAEENKKHFDQVSNDADVMPAKSAFQKPVRTTLSSTEHNSLLPQRGDMVDSLPESSHSTDSLSPPGSSDTNCQTFNIESLAPPSDQVLITDTKIDLLTSDNQVSSTNSHEERIAPEPDRSNVLQPVDVEDNTLEYAGHQGFSERTHSNDSGENKKKFGQVSNDADIMPTKSTFQKPKTSSSTEPNSLLPLCGNMVDSLPQPSHSTDSLPPPGCKDSNRQDSIIESFSPLSSQVLITDAKMDSLASEEQVPLTHLCEKPDSNDEEGIIPEPDTSNVLQPVDVEDKTLEYAGHQGFSERTYSNDSGENKKHFGQILNDADVMPTKNAFQKPKTPNNEEPNSLLLPCVDMVDSLSESSHPSDSLPPPGCNDTNCQTSEIQSLAPPSGQVYITDTKMDFLTSDNQVPLTNSHAERNSNDEEGILPNSSNVLQPDDVEDKSLEPAELQGVNERTYSSDSKESKKHFGEVPNDAEVNPSKSLFQKPSCPEMEVYLKNWLVEELKCREVKISELRSKMRSYFIENNITDGPKAVNWCYAFLERNGFFSGNGTIDQNSVKKEKLIVSSSVNQNSSLVPSVSLEVVIDCEQADLSEVEEESTSVSQNTCPLPFANIKVVIECGQLAPCNPPSSPAEFPDSNQYVNEEECDKTAESQHSETENATADDASRGSVVKEVLDGDQSCQRCTEQQTENLSNGTLVPQLTRLEESVEPAEVRIINARRLAEEGVLTDTDNCIKFLRKHRLLAKRMDCSKCSDPMEETKTKTCNDGYRWYCVGCKNATTIRKGSFFERSKVGLTETVTLTYFWAMDVPQRQIAYESGVCERSVVEWANYLREICSSGIIDKGQIGGPGHIVSIDEMKVGRKKGGTKSNGRCVKPLWLFGGIDHTTKKVFIELVPDAGRTAPIMEEMISRHIASGTTIWSDNFASYKNIEGLGKGYIHKTVNIGVYITEDGIHVNKVKNLWTDLKGKFERMKGYSRHSISSYLDEWLWRRQYSRATHFMEILKAIANNPKYDITKRIDQ